MRMPAGISKLKAVRYGMRIGNATTEAFRACVTSKREAKMRNREHMLNAAKDMDALRSENKVE